MRIDNGLGREENRLLTSRICAALHRVDLYYPKTSQADLVVNMYLASSVYKANNHTSTHRWS